MYHFSTISVEEKAALLQWFKYKPDGEKIKRQSTKNDFWGSPKSKTENRFATEFGVGPSHSIIKINGELYQIATGQNALIGKGQFGRVKFVQHLLTGKQYALKIQNFRLKKQQKKQLLQENEICKDVNLNIAQVIRAYRGEEYKFYSLMPYHGTSLKTLLEEKRLSDKKRVDIAIRLCFEIYKLHSGLLSNSATPYTHQDIKPGNTIINSDGKPVLIDYGLAQKDPQKIHDEIVATPIYMPPLRMIARKKFTQQQIDNFALERTLYMPNIAMYLLGIAEDLENNHHNLAFLLPQRFVENSPLFDFINTGGKEDDKLCFDTKVLTIAAGIILQDNNMPSPFFNLIAKHQKLAHLTLALYFSEQENPKQDFRVHLSKALSPYNPNNKAFNQCNSEEAMNDSDKKALVISYGIEENIEKACNHERLVAILKSDEALTIKKAAIILFNLELLDDNPYINGDKIHDLDVIPILKTYPELCPKIHELYHQNQHEKIVQCIHLPVSLTHILRKLKEIDRIQTIFEISRNTAILKSLLFSRSKEHSQALLYIIKHRPNISFKALDKLNRFQIDALIFLETHNLQNLFDFVMTRNNALLICNTLQFINSNLLPNAKYSLPLMLYEISQNRCYCDLLKANPKPESQFIIHHMITSNIEPKPHSNYLFLNDKARYYLFQTCKDLTLPLSVVRKIMLDAKAMHAFIQLVDVDNPPTPKIIANELQSDIRISQINEHIQLKPLGVSRGLQEIQRAKDQNAIANVRQQRKSLSDADRQQRPANIQNQVVGSSDRNPLAPIKSRPLSHNDAQNKYPNHQHRNQAYNPITHQRQERQAPARPPIPWR